VFIVLQSALHGFGNRFKKEERQQKEKPHQADKPADLLFSQEPLDRKFA
jgi:hypothetical protein